MPKGKKENKEGRILLQTPELLINKEREILDSWMENQMANITLEGKKYKTENFKETIWKLSTDIMVDEKLTGSIAVCYLEERPEPEIDKGPFLKEEVA